MGTGRLHGQLADLESLRTTDERAVPGAQYRAAARWGCTKGGWGLGGAWAGGLTSSFTRL